MAIQIESRVFLGKSASAQHPYAEAFVKPGYTLTGGGAWLDYEEPGNLLFENHPIRSHDGKWIGWSARGKDAWWASLSTITVYAVGIRVTRDGQPVELEHAVFAELGEKAVLPSRFYEEGWCGTGGGVKCEQNVFENLFIAATAIESWHESRWAC